MQQFSHHEFIPAASGNTLILDSHKVLLSSASLLPNPKLYQGNRSKNNCKARLKLKGDSREDPVKKPRGPKEGEIICNRENREKFIRGENISNI